MTENKIDNNDYINRFLFDNTDIRGEIASLESTFQNATAHQTFPKRLLPIFGDFLAAAALLAEVLKFEGILTLQANGDGDVGVIMAETTHQGNMRGIIRLKPELEKSIFNEKYAHVDVFELPQLLGKATLTITIDPEKGKRYQGIIPLEKTNLSECLEDYFQQSEQLPTQILLFSDDKKCGGLFLQCLPAQIIQDSEKRQDTWETARQLASTVKKEEIFELQNEEVLLRLFHELTCRVFPPKALQFRCTCDRDRSANALQSVGYNDAMDLIAEQGDIKIDCQFCGQVYRFTQIDINNLFKGSGSTLH